MTRGTPVLLALCLTVLLAACSNSEDGAASPSRSASPLASSSPPPASPPVDVAVAGPPAAARINLQPADLPKGFSTDPATAESAEAEATGRAISACLGEPYREPALVEVSDDFVRGGDFPTLTYASQIEFYADKALVTAELAAYQGEKLGGCAAEQIQSDLAEDIGVSFAPIVATRLPANVAGADGAFGLRFATRSTGEGQPVSFTLDLLGLTKGRTVVTLTALAFGVTTDDPERDALFATLAERGVARAL